MFRSYRTKSDEELMDLFQRGDHRGLEEIYRRYAGLLLRYMYRMLNSDEPQAQDLLHDVFLKLQEQPGLFDSKRSFRPWIFRIATNACLGVFRKKRNEVTLQQAAHIADSDVHSQKLDTGVFRTDLRLAVKALSDDHRIAFILRYQVNLSLKEVAEVMQCAEGTVKSRLHYAIKTLSEKIEHPFISKV